MSSAAAPDTVAEALAAHLVRNGLPPDGGASERFAVVRLGRLPYPIPNTSARRRAVKLHDLNHLVTGYGTDLAGESEISAWELASGGCQRYVAAWVLDLSGLLMGLIAFPRRTVRAFQAGHVAHNLYGYPYAGLLDRPMPDVMDRVRHAGGRRSARLPAPVLLAGCVVAAVPTSLLFGLAWIVVTPLWWASKRKPRLGTT
jgi:hypothetical protein